MIEVIHYQDEGVERPVEQNIADSYDEVRELLPTLPSALKIYFTNDGATPDTGVGGFAYSSDIISMSLDPDFKDKDKQLQDIRPTIFHEALHLYQNYTGEGPKYSALEGAIYEGMATVFERDCANAQPSYGDYSQNLPEELGRWLEELRNLGPEYLENEEVYRAWKFYHPQLQERWIVYKTGTWVVDQVLQKHGLNILDLRDKTAFQVLELFDSSADE